MIKSTETFVNQNGVLVEVGGTYYYKAKGSGNTRTIKIKTITHEKAIGEGTSMWPVPIDNLFYSEGDIPELEN